MALGFSSRYNQGEHASFGTLTTSHNSDVESAGTSANSESNILFVNSNGSYDCCEFSSSVVIDYTQYANIVVAEGSSSETAGSIASIGGDFSGCSSAAASCAGVSSSSGSCGGGASFTC